MKSSEKNGAADRSSAENIISDPKQVRWPFWVALGIVVLGVAGIIVANIVKPPQERLNDNGKVQRTINEYYSAQSELKYQRFRDAVCDADLGSLTEEKFIADYGTGDKTRGNINITDIKIEVTDARGTDPARATATVRWFYLNKSDEVKNELKTLIKVQDNWKVCGK